MNLWHLFVQLMASAVEGLYPIFHDWGLAIIVFTIIFRGILTPLMLKQTKSSYMMQQMQPKINEIQQRFADDPRRVQEETQRLYAEAKFNPLAGCLPMLLQFPIFIALFQALRNINEYVSFEGTFTFLNIIPDLQMSPADALAVSFDSFVPYLILLVVYVVSTFLPMLLTPTNSGSKVQTYVMAAFMSLMMLWVGWRSPAGVILYWGVSSLLGVLQTTLGRRHYAKKFAEEEAAREALPVKIEVERKTKKKRPTKKH